MVETVLESKADEGRKGDGLLLISQDNAKRQLTIEEINAAALSRLGYQEEDIKARRFEVLLGHECAVMIDEELEYHDASPDIADILARHRELGLRTHAGKEIRVPYRINRLMANHGQQYFQLIIPNDRETTARQKLREFLKTNLEGHQQLDAVTGLPDRATLQSFVERIQSFSSESGAEICVASLRIDRWDKSIALYGQEATHQLLRHVAEICRSSFRSEDVIASLDHRLGLLLVGISRESARVVFNRLRWNIQSRTIEFGGKVDFSTSVSLAFAMLTAENSATIVETCDRAIANHDPDARHAMLEI